MRKIVMLISVITMSVISFLLSADCALAIDKKFDYRIKQKVEKAIESLENKKGNVQRIAKNDLINWGADSVEPLIAIVKDWKNQPANLRIVCVDILGRIRDKKAVPVIVDALNEKKMTMRYTAARALGYIADKKAVGPLIKQLADKEWQVRFYAAEALGKIGDKSAAKPLANLLLSDPSETVRLTAIEALDKLDAKTESRAVLEAFSDKAPKIRCYAIELSSSWMVKEAVGPISSMLKTDRSNKVRASCAYALGAYDDYTAIPALIGALSDDYKDVRIYAQESLEKMSGQSYGGDKEKWNYWLELNKDKAGQL